MKTYTIEEIKYYLEGCQMVENPDSPIKAQAYNAALHHAINELEDAEEGIEAVLHRRKRMEMGFGA